MVRDELLLRAVFTWCHLALAPQTQGALQMLCRLSTAEVRRALLVLEAIMAERLTWAKQKIAHAAISYRVPTDHELPDRLRSVATARCGVLAGWPDDE